MGAMVSTLRMALQTFKSLLNDFEVVSSRISESPGIPRPNSSIPYWTIPASPIANHGKDSDLLQEVDVVIIGSGITGTSIAKALLEHKDSQSGDTTGRLNVLMLEARDVCSGATGRNGGHASPIIYNEYFGLKKHHGAAVALQIIQFRLAHITTLLDVAKEAGLLNESQARTVDNYDAFIQSSFFANAKGELERFMKEVPPEIAAQFGSTDDRETIEKLQLATSIIGLISKPGASIHPYRLVTGILSKLLDRFPNFRLYSHTPCTEISTENGKYVVTTPKGKIQARHIIHATNAWSSHLLPGLRRKIVPIKAHMSTQRPGKGLHVTDNVDNINPLGALDWTGQRAFVFYPGHVDYAYDYLTQFLPAPSSQTAILSSDDNGNPHSAAILPTAGEFMFGGGLTIGGSSEAALMAAVGVADDEHTDFAVEAYLSGALPMYFGQHWGEEADGKVNDPSGSEWQKGRVKALWTGIVAISADANPWVGRVPLSVSGRPEPQRPESTRLTSNAESFPLSHSGEWISAGYSGEGMVHAWLCGRALAHMILGVPDQASNPTLPAPFFITDKRVKRAKIEDFMDNL
ncbi:hypothetical protein JR316_0005912 [Psilocybe cubensis]|uniref:FAD dependent oxidoreductase domain-containing protein n=2 Tax=Psilocybe cubensis TaxID=181762 RepID=A0A8H8CLV0_PSICU|nr:hypothetical protein JR316_0005912 [Psilocybe cubensis]KAH9481387.1 hypothetical protein JR316_0005912 [Psilocybe cubensis]